MLQSTGPEMRSWFASSLVLVGAITALRVLALPFLKTDLFVDETQYWLWGETLDWGYYSKPPLVAWVIRLSTELGGSDAAFWIRLPGPLLQGATALVVGAIAARLFGSRAGLWAALGYATLPMVALASVTTTTDSVLVLPLGLALLAWLRAADGSRAVGYAALAGACFGLAFLGKYAALFYLPGVLLAAWPRWGLRPGWGAAAAGIAAFALVASPNLAWNALNGGATLAHTMDNAQWVREEALHLNWAQLRQFLIEQIPFFGPLSFATLVFLVLRWRWLERAPRLMLLFSLPVIVTVSAQAVLENANINWAASAYLAGAVAVFGHLARRPLWLAATIGTNAAISAALPLLVLLPGPEALGTHPLTWRFTGQHEISLHLIDTARATGARAIVSDNRSLLADLFHAGRDSGLIFRAVPPEGRPMSHYELAYPMTPDIPGLVLYASFGAAPPCEAEALPDAARAPIWGIYRRNHLSLWQVPSDCWSPGG